jgi:hypothetical protein
MSVIAHLVLFFLHFSVSITNDESLTEQAVDLLIGNDSFKNVISGEFNSVIDDLKCEILDLKKEWTIWNNIHEEHFSKYLFIQLCTLLGKCLIDVDFVVVVWIPIVSF